MEADGLLEYITGTVPASPTGTPRKPLTRRQAMIDSLVATVVLPSEWETDQEQERPQPVRRRRKGTKRLPRLQVTRKYPRRPPPPAPANKTGAATPDTSTDDDSPPVSPKGRSAPSASTARA